jgi:hypothetical protein
MSEGEPRPTQASAPSLPLALPRLTAWRDREPSRPAPEALYSVPAEGLARGKAEPSSYRPDIDGLRAIAVLAVILLHAGLKGLSGGFLGVDVFFVISGYLVHQQIAGRLSDGKFSLPAFYGRRLRRTFPALYAISAVTLVAGLFILMPGDLDALARSAAAAGLGVSNLLFAAQTGYFDHDAITKPLHRTWSLGVEEQFYLISPLIPYSAHWCRARGLPARFSPRIAAIASYYDYANRRDFREDTCFVTSGYGSVRYFDRSQCLTPLAMQPNYLLIGDSHAAHLWARFSRVFRKVHILQATASGCKPLLATGGLHYCVDLMPAIGPANFVSLYDLLCTQGRCLAYASEDVPLQFDTSHLTTQGSVIVAQRLAKLSAFAPLVEGREVSQTSASPR